MLSLKELLHLVPSISEGQVVRQALLSYLSTAGLQKWGFFQYFPTKQRCKYNINKVQYAEPNLPNIE